MLSLRCLRHCCLRAVGPTGKPAAHLYVDCSQTVAGDGSIAHPLKDLDVLSAHLFQPGEVVALKRGTHCNGSLVLHGSGGPVAPIRLTANGDGPRPKITASTKDTQAVFLKNAEGWQIDSLDIAGGNTYGLIVTGDEDRVQSNIALRNLVVHNVQGGELKEKDNGRWCFCAAPKGSALTMC